MTKEHLPIGYIVGRLLVKKATVHNVLPITIPLSILALLLQVMVQHLKKIGKTIKTINAN
jgi:hypothetical protein